MINVVGKFFEISSKEPNRTAIIFRDSKISYAELAERANAIIDKIPAADLKSNILIGLYLPRSIDLIASLMAVIKMGAGYVPLDISFPKDRIRYMLSDSGTKTLLTNNNLIHKFIPNNSNLQVVNVDDAVHSRRTKSSVVEGKTVYVIYTSGSTGKPKGVAMRHKALDNLINWQKQSSDCFGGITLQYAPIGFDVSFQEIFSTLSCGGTLVLCDEETRRDPRKLADLIVSQGIERIFMPFVAIQQLASLEECHLNCLREVITAGEQLRITPAIRDFFESLPHCKLINQYGPTETHVVTAYELSGPPKNWPNLPPIGKPIQNVRTYVFDDSLNNVSLGEVGELYIGGASLAEGYINNQSLTESVFIHHPVIGERLYKTGDLVRLLASGDIEFVGRKDRQVKIRGYRVELGEVETLLSEHSAIKECVVDGRENVPGQTMLVAYVVLKDKYRPHFKSIALHAKWTSFLKEKLPEYMIPARFIILESLPLTPTGKIDKKSLPSPTLERPQMMTAFVPPHAQTEIEIAQIWKEVLHMEEVGENDNFFELGGNSLLATYIHQRLSQHLPFKVEIVDLFQYPTVGSLAKALEARKRHESSGVANRQPQKHSNSLSDKRIIARKRYER
ncbi:MAG: Linear gramicidin synthase subunit D [candidate division WS2 bacterium]|nr:Linear gramicidin synthase subunit D [Candidatus Lithacetigena glycinireducens]